MLPIALHANCRRLAAVAACIVFAGACTGESDAPRDRSVPTATPAPTAEPSSAGPSPGTAAAGRCGPKRIAPPDVVPHYDMSIAVDPEAGVVTGRSEVTFVADRPTRRLVFRLWPNGPELVREGSALVVEKASLAGGGGSVEEPNATTLVFDLGRRLAPGDPAVARLRWKLELPGPIDDRLSQNGDAIRLGSFFPILSWEGERGWATDPPTTILGEASTSPTADFDVLIEAPKGLDVIATGRERSDGQWVAHDVRDFAVAIGRFDLVTRTVDARRPVDVTVGVAEGLGPDPRDFAQAIGRALRDLSRRYGAYPWPAFSMAVVPDLGHSGIEYPAMIFQGEKSLRTATTHEVAHSWFYGLVGNNQARDPWLDEGITSWAQARGDDELGFFRDYELPEDASGRLGRPMRYWDANPGDYYAGAYVQGVHALDAMGKARAVDCALRRYVAENAYGVATTDDLIAALEPSFPSAKRVLARFGARP